MVHGRIIFQGEVWRNLGWDAQLDPGNSKAWETWREDLKKLQGFRLLRCYRPRDFGAVTGDRLN